MKYLVMQWCGWELPVKLLGDIEAETPGAAIRAGARRWPVLRADNYFIKEKDWNDRCTPDCAKPLASAPHDDPYGTTS